MQVPLWRRCGPTNELGGGACPARAQAPGHQRPGTRRQTRSRVPGGVRAHRLGTFRTLRRRVRLLAVVPPRRASRSLRRSAFSHRAGYADSSRRGLRMPVKLDPEPTATTRRVQDRAGQAGRAAAQVYARRTAGATRHASLEGRCGSPQGSPQLRSEAQDPHGPASGPQRTGTPQQNVPHIRRPSDHPAWPGRRPVGLAVARAWQLRVSIRVPHASARVGLHVERVGPRPSRRVGQRPHRHRRAVRMVEHQRRKIARQHATVRLQ